MFFLFHTTFTSGCFPYSVLRIPFSVRSLLGLGLLALASFWYSRVYLDTLIECTALTAGPALAGESPGVDPSGGWLEAEIVREYQQIHAAALADTVKPFSNEAFDAAVQHLLAFARMRGEFVKLDVARSPR